MPSGGSSGRTSGKAPGKAPCGTGKCPSSSGNVSGSQVGGQPHTSPKVIRASEKPMPTQMKTSDAVDSWNEFLGPNQTNYNPYKDIYDPDRIFSADGTRSIRYGGHEIGEFGTSKSHFHYETWVYDSPFDGYISYNRIQRLK